MKTIILTLSATAFAVLTSCQTSIPTEQTVSIPEPAPQPAPITTTSTPIITKTAPPTPEPPALASEQSVKPYPLEICLVTDEPLDEWDEMQRIVYQNQEMKFCCKMCLKKFNANPDKYLALLPQA